jgi:hypothetical protein
MANQPSGPSAVRRRERHGDALESEEVAVTRGEETRRKPAPDHLRILTTLSSGRCRVENHSPLIQV